MQQPGLTLSVHAAPFKNTTKEASVALAIDIEGNRLECRATTRRGTQCQRVPLPHNGYCPSHQHLAEPDEIALVAA